MAKKGLSRAQVEHIAKLASLPLTTQEIPIFQEQLSKVVEYVGKIGEVKGEKGKAKGEPDIGEARKDKANATQCLSQEGALSGTGNKYNGLFVVPAIFEE